MLVATWNIANFGAQERRASYHRLLAEILSWFDLVAIQETREDFAPLFDVVHYMGARFKTIMSDVAGNSERMVYICDSRKLRLVEEIGEANVPPSQLKRIVHDDIADKFQGFDRSPLRRVVSDRPLGVSSEVLSRNYDTDGTDDRRVRYGLLFAFRAAVQLYVFYSLGKDFIAGEAPRSALYSRFGLNVGLGPKQLVQ